MTQPGVAQLARAQTALAELAAVLRENEVRSYVDLVEELERIAAEPVPDDAAAAQRIAYLARRYAALSAHRDGLDEVYLPRDTPAETRAATRHLDDLRNAVTAALSGPR